MQYVIVPPLENSTRRVSLAIDFGNDYDLTSARLSSGMGAIIHLLAV
jgi:hypothetical protein